MRESALMRQIMVRASELGGRLLRNNNGAYKIGKRFIRYGVGGPGGSDLIGWTHDGRFVAVEVKAGSPTTKEQLQFLQEVIRSKGIGILALSVDMFDKTYRREVFGQVHDNAL